MKWLRKAIFTFKTCSGTLTDVGFVRRGVCQSLVGSVTTGVLPRFGRPGWYREKIQLPRFRMWLQMNSKKVLFFRFDNIDDNLNKHPIAFENHSTSYIIINEIFRRPIGAWRQLRRNASCARTKSTAAKQRPTKRTTVFRLILISIQTFFLKFIWSKKLPSFPHFDITLINSLCCWAHLNNKYLINAFSPKWRIN